MSFSRQSEIHYGVLQLLLSLSENPTGSPWKPPRGEDPVRQGMYITTINSYSSMCAISAIVCVCVVEEEERFDWQAYLREGIEFQTYSDSDSEVCNYPSPWPPLLLLPPLSFFFSLTSLRSESLGHQNS